MLHDPTRHEALLPIAWDEQRARDTITRIVADTEARFTPSRCWPAHHHRASYRPKRRAG